MPDIVFVFEVHQPYRLARDVYRRLVEKALRGRLTLEDIEDALFDQPLNKLVMERAASKCYIPATRIILENVKRFSQADKKFKVAFSLSGVFIEQAKKWAPQVLDLFRELAETGLVEFVEQTYYHSMVAFLGIPGNAELIEQVLEHRRLIEEEFGVRPSSIENTEFSYNNDIASLFASMGYRVVLTEGVERVLGWRSPNYVYKAYGSDIRVLTRNYRLSDDVGFRFSDRNWDQYPLTADKYAAWLSATPGDVILIAVDYETFGEHHWPETGIHEFLRWLPGEILKYWNLSFSTPSEAAEKYPARDVIDIPPWASISWADERDLSAWLGNSMQQSSARALYDLYFYVEATGDQGLKRLWKLLTISDHLYYQATKFGSIGEVHAYFSPYKNASDAYALFMEAVGVLSLLVSQRIEKDPVGFLARFKTPPEKAFYFYSPLGGYTGLKASSLPEFREAIWKVPDDVFVYHLRRGDYSEWFRNVFMLPGLAEEIERARDLGADEARKAIDSAIRRYLGG
ncbi:alpha-amylase [Thermogladius sp. 4427co]|uniref:glycoside hydrolase family 57 protein n=1 Tax=Thermogladius sp. 4427co TaxID=3450718 RepID=UPI003F7B027B